MTPLEQFAQILWQYDAKHIEKQRKNPRYHRNPYAVLHYKEALARAESLASDDTLESAIAALSQCFEPQFWPLKQFKKVNGVAQ